MVLQCEDKNTASHQDIFEPYKCDAAQIFHVVVSYGDRYGHEVHNDTAFSLPHRQRRPSFLVLIPASRSLRLRVNAPVSALNGKMPKDSEEKHFGCRSST